MRPFLNLYTTMLKSTILFVVIFCSSCCFGQCPEILQPIHVPCCISGIDWSEQEKTLFLVSDLENKVYLARIDMDAGTVSVFDSLPIVSAPHNKGLEAVRKV